MKHLFLVLLLSLVACQQTLPSTTPPTDEQPVDSPDTPENPTPPETPEAPPPEVHNALWSDPATWGGELPKAGEDVVILPEQKILLDVSPPGLGSLKIAGSLIFDKRDIELSARWIRVTGSLEIGSQEEPFTHNATITLTGPDKDIMGMSNKFLVAVEGGYYSNARRTADLLGAAC